MTGGFPSWSPGVGRYRHRHGNEGMVMADHIYSISELVGSSSVSVDEAIKGAITRASKTLHNLDWFEVTNIRGHIENNELSHFQVTLKVGFRVDDPS